MPHSAQSQLDSAEDLGKEVNFSDSDLQHKADDKSEDHGAVFQMVHAEDAALDVAHADRVEQLRNAQHGKGISLRVVEHIRILKYSADSAQGDRPGLQPAARGWGTTGRRPASGS